MDPVGVRWRSSHSAGDLTRCHQMEDHISLQKIMTNTPRPVPQQLPHLLA